MGVCTYPLSNNYIIGIIGKIGIIGIDSIYTAVDFGCDKEDGCGINTKIVILIGSSLVGCFKSFWHNKNTKNIKCNVEK